MPSPTRLAVHAEVALVLVERLRLPARRLQQHLVAEQLHARPDQPPNELQELRVPRHLLKHRIEPRRKRDPPHRLIRRLRPPLVRNRIPSRPTLTPSGALLGSLTISSVRRLTPANSSSVSTLSTTRYPFSSKNDFISLLKIIESPSQRRSYPQMTQMSADFDGKLKPQMNADRDGDGDGYSGIQDRQGPSFLNTRTPEYLNTPCPIGVHRRSSAVPKVFTSAPRISRRL